MSTKTVNELDTGHVPSKLEGAYSTLQYSIENKPWLNLAKAKLKTAIDSLIPYK